MIDIAKKIAKSFIPFTYSAYVAARRSSAGNDINDQAFQFSFIGFNTDVISSVILYDSFNRVCMGEYVKGALEGLAIIGMRAGMYLSLEKIEHGKKQPYSLDK